MGDILSFPTRQSQGLTFLEREMRKLLLSKGADQALIDFAAGQLTGIYQKISASEQQSISFSLPDGLNREQRDLIEKEVEGALGQVHSQNHRLLLELAAQLVLAQLRLFQSSRNA